MARAVKNSRIDSRSKRLQRDARPEPYWQTLQTGLAVGYYRPRSGGDGSWWGRARVGGRYVVESIAAADDHADADAVSVLNWAQAQQRVREWAAKQTESGPLTVEQAIKDYLGNLRSERGNRAEKDAEGRLNCHVPASLRSRNVADLTTSELLQWRNGLVPDSPDNDQARRSRDTANRIWATLKTALNHAFKTGRVADDRQWHGVSRFKGVGMARKTILDEGELQRLVDACEPGLRELVAVGALTGARLGELTSARVSAFDAEAGTLTVSGKTGSRSIYLSKATTAMLRRIASGRRLDQMLLQPIDRPYWTRGLHDRPFDRAVRKAGLDPATTFYSLRHSFISNSLRNLVPTKALADSCGTSALMIERHYAKFIIADRRHYAELGSPRLALDPPEKVTKLRAG